MERGCTLEGGNPGVSLPLQERMCAGGVKFWDLCIMCGRVCWRGEILGCPHLHNVLVEDVHWRGEILGCPYLCIMWGGGCTLEGGNPGVSLPLHNVWERMYAGGGKSWGVPTSA